MAVAKPGAKLEARDAEIFTHQLAQINGWKNPAGLPESLLLSRCPMVRTRKSIHRQEDMRGADRQERGSLADGQS